MKRILMVQPSLNPPGGGNGVAAWMVEALRGDHQVSLLTWETPRLDSINQFYGTSLLHSDFDLILLPRIVRAIVEHTPTPMALIKDNYMLVRGRRLSAKFDVVISANNEVDLGRPGIQYIHYPKIFSRPEVDMRWFHRLPFSVGAYRWASFRLSGFSLERMRRNLFLVNSEFIGARVRAVHGVPTITLYPPIAGDFPAVDWERRENGFVCIGRISGEKRIDRIIEILSKVRDRGRPVHLHIVGTFGRASYSDLVRGCIEANRSWVTMHENLPRREMERLVASHRYGIHAMEDEHFGMAVAEMVRAGCIVFAYNGGGPVEILGADDRLLYNSPADAVEKITLALDSSERQQQLRDHLARCGAQFSADHFVSRFRELVDRFEPG